MRPAHLNDCIYRRTRNNSPGRVVGRVDGDQIGIGPDGVAALLDIEESMAITVQRNARDLADRQRDAFGGLTIGRRHNGVVGFLE